MTIYSAVCLYVWHSSKHTFDYYDIIYNEPFLNEKDAYKKLHADAKEIIEEIQDWLGPDNPVRIIYHANGSQISQTMPLSEATIPEGKIMDYQIKANKGRNLWLGRVEEHEISDFRQYQSSGYKYGKYLSEIVEDSSHDLSYNSHTSLYKNNSPIVK